MKSLLDKGNIRRRIRRHKVHLKRYESTDKPHEVFNFHGGESYGYHRGCISVLYDLLDELLDTLE